MTAWPSLANRVQAAGQRVFGEQATYTPAGGGEQETISGIFNGAAERVAIVDGIDIETTVPVLTVHLADLAVAPKQGARLTFRTVLYRVSGVEPDGQGDADLVLEKA